MIELGRIGEAIAEILNELAMIVFGFNVGMFEVREGIRLQELMEDDAVLIVLNQFLQHEVVEFLQREVLLELEFRFVFTLFREEDSIQQWQTFLV